MITIRNAEEADFDAIWRIFHQVVRQGDTYTYDPETTRAQAYSIWMSSEHTTYVASIEDQFVGTYILRANQPGLGSHVANAGYMVSNDGRGKGVGKAMCEHSLQEARRMGFHAMQFNMVIRTNESAVALWKKFGFSIVGTLPQAYRHREFGLVDAYVMHRFL
jgi:L-amino acid N-acyltransferase YncA